MSGTLNRTYTPPPEGSFDPYTVGITGALPAFYTYGPATPVAPPPAEGGLDTFQPSDGGAGGSQGGGGLGDGGVNMGGQMAGGIDLGPNPGNLGNLGNIGNLGLGDFSLRDAARGFALGNFAAGPLGGLIGGAIGGFYGGSSTDKGIGDTTPDTGPTPGEKGDPIGGGEKGGPNSGTPGEAESGLGMSDQEGGGGFGNNAADGWKTGGIVKLAEGGLVPLAGGGKVAVGPGGGLDDLIPTSINGRRAAALSDGEFVIPADVVSMMGDGSSNAGARRLYDLVRQVRDNKTGTTRQAGPLPVGDILKRSLGE